MKTSLRNGNRSNALKLGGMRHLIIYIGFTVPRKQNRYDEAQVRNWIRISDYCDAVVAHPADTLDSLNVKGVDLLSVTSMFRTDKCFANNFSFSVDNNKFSVGAV